MHAFEAFKRFRREGEVSEARFGGECFVAHGVRMGPSFGLRGKLTGGLSIACTDKVEVLVGGKGLAVRRIDDGAENEDLVSGVDRGLFSIVELEKRRAAGRRRVVGLRRPEARVRDEQVEADAQVCRELSGGVA